LGSVLGSRFPVRVIPSDNERSLKGGSFFRSRWASEALGIFLLLAGILTALALFSYDSHDPNLFSLTTGDPAAPSNWIGRFGASLASALYALLGLAAWGVPVALLAWGWQRFWQRPVENPGSKAAGLALLFLSVPSLLSLLFGRRSLFGSEMETGGVVGRALGAAAKGRLGATGALLLLLALALLAVPLATQVSLAEVFLGLRDRPVGPPPRPAHQGAAATQRRRQAPGEVAP
jgi:DNA segregation ATPase FtsK/SpoIIIE-like protein